MRPLLAKLISPNQSAFILGRWIGDNIVLVNEICHSFKKKKGSNGRIGTKFNMHKSIRSSKWDVLNEILIRVGFSAPAIGLLNQCFSNDATFLLLSGSLCGSIKLERGLRRGGLISPYLYIIFAEFISGLLHTLELEGKIHSIKLGRTSPPISHLSFADAIMIFYKANKAEVQEVANCMQKICKWTGQMVNFAKSGYFFSKNIPGNLKAELKCILNIKELPKDAKYLGNPFFVGKSRTEDFTDLQQRVSIKLQSWKANLLFGAGRFVLVKSVLTVIPRYTLSTHKLPLSSRALTK
nr:uncharacterized protein LOC125423394 [Ziziphus jujuba var. spinosa]